MSRAIDFSAIPFRQPRVSIPYSTILKVIRGVVLYALALVGISAVSGLTNNLALRNVLLYIWFGSLVWLYFRRASRHTREHLSTMQEFAVANGWTYAGEAEVDKATIPVADEFKGQGAVTRGYRISGTRKGDTFSMSLLSSLGPNVSGQQMTILETNNPAAEPSGLGYIHTRQADQGVVAYIYGELQYREDAVEMFRAAGLL